MNEPKFKVGDRVTDGVRTGTIEDVHVMYKYWFKDRGMNVCISEPNLSYAKLSAEDAWVETALMVGVQVVEYGTYLWGNETKEIRHKAYQILAGNGVKVTEEVKARVRGLIERAVAQHS